MLNRMWLITCLAVLGTLTMSLLGGFAIVLSRSADKVQAIYTAMEVQVSDVDSCRRVCLDSTERRGKGRGSPPSVRKGELPLPQLTGRLDNGTKSRLQTLGFDDMEELLYSVRYEFKGTKEKDNIPKMVATIDEGIARYRGYRERERVAGCSDMWQPFQCRGGRRIAGIRVNHLKKDVWKLDRVRHSACQNGFQIDWTESVWPGVLAKDRPDILQHAIGMNYMSTNMTDKGKVKLGNVGAGLSHITLWEHIANHSSPDDVFLLMEDNVLFQPEALVGLCLSMTAAGDFDFLNLSVLRPRGIKIDDTLGLLRVTKEEVKDPGLPNVWLSSYLITGRGAAKMLRCFQRFVPNLGHLVVDRVVVHCAHSDENISAYVIDHHRFFGHVETGGDARTKLNGDNPDTKG